MKRLALVFGVLLFSAVASHAYVEAPYTLGKTVLESTHVVLIEVTKVNQEKGLIIYKKVRDIKGVHPKDEIKHNIGKRGFHEREWQNVMKWAEVGKKAVFFHNGQASETCIGTYWYQCYPEGEWWGMSHAEPFMLRTYCGDTEKLAGAVKEILEEKEAVVPCMADGKADLFHLRKGKMQTVRASLKRIEYNPKRDFVAWGSGEGDDNVKTVTLIGEGSNGWRYLPEPPGKLLANRWIASGFLDNTWKKGRAPIGHGDEDIDKRKGTLIKEPGSATLFRREFEMPEHLLKEKGAIIRLSVASKESATVWINGKLADQDPAETHNSEYWNREVAVDAGLFQPGRNLVAVQVRHGKGGRSSFFDLDLTVHIPVAVKAPANPK